MKPRIFISAVSSELRTIRGLVSNVLERLGYEPVRQDIFGTKSGDLRQALRETIDDCDGLVQIVGHGYGAEPPLELVDPTLGRVSYTQFEFLYALQKQKKTWLIYAGEACTGYDNFEHMRQHPDLTPLHTLPEFEALFPKKKE